uniref:Immunoglobulin V-set domain-containing protein n=1 Tax=Malurus cyaneus samueli TaxID=2593467 RepID=A0A8C5X1Q0_9PASS
SIPPERQHGFRGQLLGGSLELSNDTSFSLRIKNVTSQKSGTYKCTLGGQSGEHNLSSTVTLKVTGCPGTEEDKLKKYKSELFMLTCLGIFYLLLIFFTCVSNSLSHKQSNKTKQDTPTCFLF